jgi:hypothetical protein
MDPAARLVFFANSADDGSPSTEDSRLLKWKGSGVEITRATQFVLDARNVSMQLAVNNTLSMEWAPSRRVDAASKGQLGN